MSDWKLRKSSKNTTVVARSSISVARILSQLTTATDFRPQQYYRRFQWFPTSIKMRIATPANVDTKPAISRQVTSVRVRFGSRISTNLNEHNRCPITLNITGLCRAIVHGNCGRSTIPVHVFVQVSRFAAVEFWLEIVARRRGIGNVLLLTFSSLSTGGRTDGSLTVLQGLAFSENVR